MASAIDATTILSTIPGRDSWFGLKYNMNLYRGCSHGCIYCDSRSDCYRLGKLSNIRYKQNALDILNTELLSKRKIGTIGTGSMNDPYQPSERSIRLTRGALEVIARRGFPIHVLTKSNLVCRDSDLLKEISSIFAIVSFSIITLDDRLASILEPCAPPPSERFDAIRRLSSSGIRTGILMMPVLPFVCDTVENVRSMVGSAAECGASYISAWFGLTLRDTQRNYFLERIDRVKKGLCQKYKSTFGGRYRCDSPRLEMLKHTFEETCEEYGISTSVPRFSMADTGQLSLFPDMELSSAAP